MNTKVNVMETNFQRLHDEFHQQPLDHRKRLKVKKEKKKVNFAQFFSILIEHRKLTTNSDMALNSYI